MNWADANAICDAILDGEPYRVRAGICEASGFMNQANSTKYWNALNSLDFFVVQDLWKTPTAGAADMLLPVYHWLEVDFPRVSQGSTGAMGATCRAIEPPAECRFSTGTDRGGPLREDGRALGRCAGVLGICGKGSTGPRWSARWTMWWRASA